MKYIYLLITRLILIFLFLLKVEIFYPLLLILTLYPVFGFFYFLDYEVVVVENILTINGIPAEFVEACLAGSAYLLLIILTLLTKGISLVKRVYIILTGSFLILVANILRIILILIILVNGNKNLFQVIHLIIWQLMSTIYVVFIWIALSKIFKIKSIPLYSDLITVIKMWKETFK